MTLWSLPDASVAALATLATRNLTLHGLVQDGQVTLSSSGTTVTIEPRVRQRPE